MTQQRTLETAMALNPIPGESVCGDQAGAWPLGDHKLLVALADGLGHGQVAHDDAAACIRTVGQYSREPVADIVRRCLDCLRLARGAALAVAVIDIVRNSLTFAGVGNISALVSGENTHRFVSTAGIVGHDADVAILTQCARFFPPSDCFFMATDGLGDTEEFSQFRPGLFPSLQTMADLMIRRGATGRDDAGLVVVG